MRCSVIPGSDIGCSGAKQLTLRERLDRFDLDDPDSRLKFSERLARENNWTLRYARRVVAEYKRFLELAVTAGHTVTPSDDVDQAWHLHMVYTRSYWNDLCKNVLQQPLHHGPTKGGQEERERYEDLYARTVESYCATFGEQPPADIWPDSEERFRQSIQSVRVDKGRNWVIPKPSWAQVAGVGAFASVPLFVGASDALLGAGLPNVDGKQFLAIYIILLMVALAVSFLLRARMRTDIGPGQTPPKPEQVGWAASAVLVGGYNRAVMAVISKLRAEGSVNLVKNRLVFDTKVAEGLSTSPPTGSYDSSGWSPQSATPSSIGKTISDTKEDLAIVSAAKKLIGSKESGIKIDKFVSSLQSELNRTTIQLEQLDLWTSSGERLSKGLTTAGPLFLLMLLGIARCILGVSRDRPIGFLVVLLILTGIACLIFISSFPRRTRLGDLYISQLQNSYPRSPAGFGSDKYEKENASSYDSATATPFLMGLYGTAFMSQFAMGDDAAFYSTLKTQSHSVGGGDGGAFLNGGGCGGDGGGGGCGGGGCGGCGGCGG